MKIPHEDGRADMKRRWTDIRHINKFRFYDLYDVIEECNELGKDEFFQLKDLIDKKLKALKS
jgi:hypothetical protein